MKQNTTTEQTAKLIELGFEPSTRIPFEVGNDELGRTFSIGELIEMLPEDSFMWTVEYDGVCFSPYEAASNELIDALYDMIIMLKEEGVI